jgi:hypothetical protein
MTTTTSKTDRIYNRAPKGGAISPVNSRFYKGGQFMPMVAVVVEVKQATPTTTIEITVAPGLVPEWNTELAGDDESAGPVAAEVDRWSALARRLAA